MAGRMKKTVKRGGLYEGQHPEGNRADLADLAAPAGSFNPSTWGMRHNPEDGRKGSGWLGVLRRIDDPKQVSTEIGITTNFDGKDMDIPLLVPTLSRPEVQHLLSNEQLDFDHPLMQSITRKANDHALFRLKKGQSVWRD